MPRLVFVCTMLLWCLGPLGATVLAEVAQEQIYKPGDLKPVDSVLKVKAGQKAPDFELPTTRGGTVKLSDYRGVKNVVLSFVPAAFTPVCSGQWPGYNIARPLFEQHDAVLIGITTDNVPSLYAWTSQMGALWFTVASDFWPHGEAAKRYGVLRSDGTTERALFVIDKEGVIRWYDVHDINKRPPLDHLVEALFAVENGGEMPACNVAGQ